jgi:putative ABC transport system substrate-binding protein
MRRRKFITLFGGTALAWPLAARAQELGRIYRLGVLSFNPRTRTVPYYDAMFNELRRLGFAEGQNLTVEWHQFGPRPDLLPEFAADLVKVRVDVIYAVGDFAIRAAQRATTTIPILGVANDIVGSGLVNSLARPDGNTTGFSIFAPELDGKRQEILIEVVPGLRRMAVLADANMTTTTQLQALQDAARVRNVELSIHRITRPEEIPAAIDAAKASGAQALNRLASAMLTANHQIIVQRVAALRLPAIYPWAEAAEEGGFIAYGPRYVQLFREVATPQLVKLLRGIKPADIPVEQPTKFELVVNLKTSKALGLTIPEAFLLRADTVIE